MKLIALLFVLAGAGELQHGRAMSGLPMIGLALLLIAARARMVRGENPGDYW